MTDRQTQTDTDTRPWHMPREHSSRGKDCKTRFLLLSVVTYLLDCINYYDVYRMQMWYFVTLGDTDTCDVCSWVPARSTIMPILPRPVIREGRHQQLSQTAVQKHTGMWFLTAVIRYASRRVSTGCSGKKLHKVCHAITYELFVLGCDVCTNIHSRICCQPINKKYLSSWWIFFVNWPNVAVRYQWSDLQDGVPSQRSFAAPHFCNRTSQSHAVFNKMSRN